MVRATISDILALDPRKRHDAVLVENMRTLQSIRRLPVPKFHSADDAQDFVGVLWQLRFPVDVLALAR